MTAVINSGGGCMEQHTRRERKKEETRRRILEAAFRLFAEQGFENTTIVQITGAADIGKGTFYNYFPSKEALLNDFMDELSCRRGQKIWSRVLKCQDTRQRLLVSFESIASWLEEYPELVRVYMMDRMNMIMKNSASYKPSHLELYMEEIIKMGQEDGDIRDDLAAMQIVSYLMGIFMIQLCNWYATGAGPGLYRLAMNGVDFFLIGALSTVKE